MVASWRGTLRSDEHWSIVVYLLHEVASFSLGCMPIDIMADGISASQVVC
jgi:hypothetical protein